MPASPLEFAPDSTWSLSEQVERPASANHAPWTTARALALVAAILGCSIASAQDRPDPDTGFHVPAIAFQGIKIVQQPVPGHVIEKGNLVLRDGQIEVVGPD